MTWTDRGKGRKGKIRSDGIGAWLVDDFKVDLIEGKTYVDLIPKCHGTIC